MSSSFLPVDENASSSSCFGAFPVGEVSDIYRSVDGTQERSDVAGEATQHCGDRLLLRKKKEPQDTATKASVCEVRPESPATRPVLRD